MIFCGLWSRLQKFLALNSDIQGSFKKLLLLFRQAEIIFVEVWFFYHFLIEPAPPINSIWIITFVSHLYVWVTEFKPSLIFIQLPVLTSNNVIRVNFSAILFDDTQHSVKTYTTCYVPVCHETVNLLFFFLLDVFKLEWKIT